MLICQQKKTEALTNFIGSTVHFRYIHAPRKINLSATSVVTSGALRPKRHGHPKANDARAITHWSRIVWWIN
jgi:hypothetical protein